MKAFETRSGPQVPITAQGNLLLASGCEQRNCSNFNWAYLIMNRGEEQIMQVCRHDNAKMGKKSSWYEDGKLKARLPGDCPSNLRELTRRVRGAR